MSGLVKFAESISGISLTNFQKDFLEKFESARKNGEKLFVTFPRMCGRKMILDIIREYEQNIQGIRK